MFQTENVFRNKIKKISACNFMFQTSHECLRKKFRCITYNKFIIRSHICMCSKENFSLIDISARTRNYKGKCRTRESHVHIGYACSTKYNEMDEIEGFDQANQIC